MDELDLHCWVNLFRNCEAEIKPLLHLIINTIQGLHGYQEYWVVGIQRIHIRSGKGHGPENYNNLLNSGKWSKKNIKDTQILALVGVSQKIEYDCKKSFEKYSTSNMESTKGEPAYIRDLPPWMLEEPKDGVLHKTEDGK